jgi:hypothetical protein
MRSYCHTQQVDTDFTPQKDWFFVTFSGGWAVSLFTAKDKRKTDATSTEALPSPDGGIVINHLAASYPSALASVATKKAARYRFDSFDESALHKTRGFGPLLPPGATKMREERKDLAKQGTRWL